MQAQANEIVSIPGIDLPYYLGNIQNFLMNSYPAIYHFLDSSKVIIVIICILLSTVFFIGIIISVEGIKHIRRKEDEIYSKGIEMAYIEDNKGDEEISKRWHIILDHMNSMNQNDWKQAIIDADTILDDLVNKLGYRGDSLGEKLKKINKGDFITLDDAWEAHKVRNVIAHDGSSFTLNQLEAKRVIDLYRKVFEEFYHIAN